MERKKLIHFEFFRLVHKNRTLFPKILLSNDKKTTYCFRLGDFLIYFVKNTHRSPAMIPFFSLSIKKSLCLKLAFCLLIITGDTKKLNILESIG